MHSTYQPAPHVLDRLSQVSFVAVIGPTAVGKTTLTRAACRKELSLHPVISSTTRTPRPEERQGVDFHFETHARMEERVARGEYVQVVPTAFGDTYATAVEDYFIDGVAVMPVLADAVPVFRNLPFKSIRSIFILPPDWNTWQRRMQEHHFTADKLAQRLTEAKSSFAFALEDTATQFVINHDLEVATDDFITLALGRPWPERLQNDQLRAHELLRGLLELLEQQTFDPASL